MSGETFSRTIINLLEKGVSADINQAQSQLDRDLREMLDALTQTRTSDTNDVAVQSTAARCVGSAFKVRPVAGALQVTVDPGLAFVSVPTDVPTAIGGIVGLDDRSRMKPLPLQAQVTFNIPPPPGIGLYRVDTIEVAHARRVTDPTSRMIFNTVTKAFAPGIVNKTLEWALDGQTGQVIDPAPSATALSYRQGATQALPVPATGPAVIPAATPGYTVVGYVIVEHGDANVDGGVDGGRVMDMRRIWAPYDALQVSFSVRRAQALGAAVLERVVCPPGIDVVAAAVDLGGVQYINCFILTNTSSSIEVFARQTRGTNPVRMYVPDVGLPEGAGGVINASFTETIGVRDQGDIQGVHADHVAFAARGAPRIGFALQLSEIISGSSTIGPTTLDPFGFDVLIRARST